MYKPIHIHRFCLTFVSVTHYVKIVKRKWQIIWKIFNFFLSNFAQIYDPTGTALNTYCQIVRYVAISCLHIIHNLPNQLWTNHEQTLKYFLQCKQVPCLTISKILRDRKAPRLRGGNGTEVFSIISQNKGGKREIKDCNRKTVREGDSAYLQG